MTLGLALQLALVNRRGKDGSVPAASLSLKRPGELPRAPCASVAATTTASFSRGLYIAVSPDEQNECLLLYATEMLWLFVTQQKLTGTLYIRSFWENLVLDLILLALILQTIPLILKFPGN